jgi:hypothetical protein
MNPTRADIAKLLQDIAPPGEKQDEKIEAVKALGIKNKQNIGVHEILESFLEF